MVTPDVLVVAVVLLSAGLILRIRCGAENPLYFATLGFVLGLGYLAKAAMFPLGFVFLGASFLALRRTCQAVPRFLLAVSLFLLISAPFILALSHSKGRFTWGDSAAISYAELVNGATISIHWQGQPTTTGMSTGTPKHPTRKILESPPVYEYAEPVGGSYPPWTDPSYWYDGIRPHFNMKQQLRALEVSLVNYHGLLVPLAGLCTGFIVLLLWNAELYGFARIFFFREAFIWAPAAAGLVMYSLVWVEPRYVSGFIMLLWAALFLALRMSPSDTDHNLVRCVTVAIVLTLGIQIVESEGQSLVALRDGRTSPDWEVAQGLSGNGVSPGSKVAFIGFAAWDHYWAHLANVSITSEVAGEGVSEFWAADSETKSRIKSIFAQTGAKVIVAKQVPAPLLAEGWILLPNTNYYIFPLQDRDIDWRKPPE